MMHMIHVNYVKMDMLYVMDGVVIIYNVIHVQGIIIYVLYVVPMIMIIVYNVIILDML